MKTKASALGMTALLTLNSASLAFCGSKLEERGLLTQLMKLIIQLITFQICYVSYSRDSNTKWFRSMYLDDDGDKKRTVALDRLMWIAIALCAGSALVSFVDYLWQPK